MWSEYKMGNWEKIKFVSCSALKMSARSHQTVDTVLHSEHNTQLLLPAAHCQ